MTSSSECRTTRKKIKPLEEGANDPNYGVVILVDKGEKKYKHLINILSRPFAELVKRTDMQIRTRRGGR